MNDLAFDYVIFDCDSTLSAIEGIDRLAEWHGCGEQVAGLTASAMDGALPLQDVYAERLKMIAPRREEMDRLAEAYAAQELPGARHLIQLLRRSGKEIAVISGGLRPPVLRFARSLGLREEDVFAVDLFWDEQGNYAGVLPSPLTTDTGKAAVAGQWLQGFARGRSVLIGDGSSDLAARSAVDVMIAYGGVCLREKVAAQADGVYKHLNLLGLLPYLLGEAAFNDLHLPEEATIRRLYEVFFDVKKQ